MRKNHFNERFFESVQTPEQAYWLGFIAADGSVTNSRGSYRLEIGLAIKDRCHLSKFINAIGSNDKQIKNRKSSCRVSLYSKKLIADLALLGILPRKTFVVKPWDGPKILMRHYWRGVFDGDGGFSSTYKKKRKIWTALLVGNKSMVKGFMKFIASQTSFPSSAKMRKHSSIWSIHYGGIRPSQAVANILYETAEPYLKRKKQKAEEIISLRLCQTVINELNTEALCQAYDRLKNWSKVAAVFGVSHNGMYKHIRKLNLHRRKWKHKSALFAHDPGPAAF